MTQRIKTKLSIRAAPANPASPAWALAVFGMVLGVVLGTAAELPVPGRLLTAPTGSELAEKWAGLSVEEREQEIETEILNGNIPAFLRQLHPVILRQNEAGRTNWIQIYVARDYLAVGSDDDPLYAPMTPRTAQRIADQGAFSNTSGIQHLLQTFDK